ncbi:MAG: GNAT family N-acetyltransferase [Firmicutes bacterium]|nr:GNAT family N-acetyltransferase [Bacillota bacterium]
MDEVLNLVLKYVPLTVSVLALFFSLFNNIKSHKKSVYFEIDNQYAGLLKIALQYPEFRDFNKTSVYINEDKNSDFFLRYHVYAYMVWNTIETIFDQSRKNKKSRIKLDTWLPVIKDENKIHYSWFTHNIHLFKPLFSDYVINKLNNLLIKRVSANEIHEIYPYYVRQFATEERKSQEQLKHLLSSDSYRFYIAYHNYLPKNENIIGYAFIFIDDKNKGLWIDYLAVVPGFQSAGYGTTIFNKVVDEASGGNYNVFIEVETAESDDPQNPRNKRERFYQKLNCRKMPYEYYLPTPAGKERLHLYCRPKDNNGTIHKSNIQAVMTNALSFIHSDLTHAQGVIEENSRNMTQAFHYE